MNKIGFNILQVIVETDKGAERFISPGKETFTILESSIKWSDNSTFYDVTIEKSDDYLWMYFNFGKASPRSETVTNISTGEQTANQRKEDEAELLNQLFALYHYSQEKLFLSSIQKKAVVQQLLTEKLQTNIQIKSFYKSPQEIISILKSVNKVRFTSVNNLFSHDSKARRALVDLTGTDSPETFTLEATYSTHKIQNFISGLIEGRNNNQIQSLLICGRDEKDIEMMYNIETLSRRIDVITSKNEETGMFEPNDVKEALLNCITNEE